MSDRRRFLSDVVGPAAAMFIAGCVPEPLSRAIGAQSASNRPGPGATAEPIATHAPLPTVASTLPAQRVDQSRPVEQGPDFLTQILRNEIIQNWLKALREPQGIKPRENSYPVIRYNLSIDPAQWDKEVASIMQTNRHPNVLKATWTMTFQDKFPALSKKYSGEIGFQRIEVQLTQEPLQRADPDNGITWRGKTGLVYNYFYKASFEQAFSQYGVVTIGAPDGQKRAEAWATSDTFSALPPKPSEVRTETWGPFPTVAGRNILAISSAATSGVRPIEEVLAFSRVASPPSECQPNSQGPCSLVQLRF